MGNLNIYEMVGVAPIEGKLRENGLRWSRRIQRRQVNVKVKKSNWINVGWNAMGRGKPLFNLNEHIALDRVGGEQWFI